MVRVLQLAYSPAAVGLAGRLGLREVVRGMRVSPGIAEETLSQPLPTRNFRPAPTEGCPRPHQRETGVVPLVRGSAGPDLHQGKSPRECRMTGRTYINVTTPVMSWQRYACVWHVSGTTLGNAASPQVDVVGDTGIEPVTSTVSR
jgi:hypothetical protein